MNTILRTIANMKDISITDLNALCAFQQESKADIMDYLGLERITY